MYPRLVRIFGYLLLLLAGAGAFVWFYWLAPLRHLSSGIWLADHSPERQWMEVKRQLKRGSHVHHNSGGWLGLWGDKDWMGWLIKQMNEGRNLSGCSNGHLDKALPWITNQGEGFDERAWRSWWTTNRNFSQVEWIRAGFTQAGIQLQQPLTASNILALLKVASPFGVTNSAGASTRQDKAFRYNACRWLRDSGFRPQNFDLAIVPLEDRNRIAGCLWDYANWLGKSAEFPGRLPLESGPTSDTDVDVPNRVTMIDHWALTWLPHLAAIISAGFGILLLRRAGKPAKPSPNDGIH